MDGQSLNAAPARSEELLFVPLGGAGEIGMNLNLYGYGGRWLIVDCGVTFGDATTPGVDVIMPDPSFIVERRKDLVGIVLTHAHEDHIGAVPHLWPRLRCPIYATPFTAAVLRRKLDEAGLRDEAKITVIPISGEIHLDPFHVRLITTTHSIPEPNALAIRTPAGTVLHTGDWKFDPEPMLGPTADFDALRKLGDEGVLALIGDSTNVFREGEAGSEADVRDSLITLFGQHPGVRLAVACFASNVARLESIAVAAEVQGRRAALVGRSMRRMVEAAREAGYLKNCPPLLSEDAAADVPRDEVLLICTGSQGEARAALSRIAHEDHPHISLERDDVVIFSSRIIPGNEKEIFRLQNQLTRLGVNVLTEQDHFVHVSGHPAREELKRMYGLVRPKIAVPVHGELRHLHEHADLAKSCAVPLQVVIENGAVLRLAPGAPTVVDHIHTGKLVLDGGRIGPLEEGPLRERQRIAWRGAAATTLVFNRGGDLAAEPTVSAFGVGDERELDMLRSRWAAAMRDAVAGMPTLARRDDDAVRDAARGALRRQINYAFGRKPIIDVRIVRLS